MERNIEDFLKDPTKNERMDSLTEDQFYETLEEELYETMMQIMAPFQNQTTIQQNKLTPLSRNQSSREYAYSGKATQVVKRQDKIKMTKNKDLNVAKSTIHAAFKAIIAASNKTKLGAEITNTLRNTEKRLFQKIDQKLKAEKKNEIK